MKDKQPLIIPPANFRHLPVASHQVTVARRRYSPPRIRQQITRQQVPQTPMPQFFPVIGTRPPQTPPILIRPGLSTRTSFIGTPGRAVSRYIPQKVERKEVGLGESLLGCGVLMVIGIAILALLYYLSSPK